MALPENRQSREIYPFRGEAMNRALIDKIE